MSEATVDSFLLTRFNLPSAGPESLIRAKEGWLRDRVGLFETYCLPSVAEQTTSDFTWVIYFDTQSPDWLKSWISEHERAGHFRPIFRDSVDNAELLADLREVVGTPRSHLLTTNLDNDDGLALDFVERLRAVSPTSQRRAVFCTHGLIKSGSDLYWRVDPHNAFASVLEPWDGARTCWSEWHNLLAKSMPVVELGGAPGWLQVVHGTNVSNRVRGRRVAPQGYDALFGPRIADARAPGRREVVLDRVVTGPARLGWETARGAAKAVIMRTVGKDGLDRLKLRLGALRRRIPLGR